MPTLTLDLDFNEQFILNGYMHHLDKAYILNHLKFSFHLANDDMKKVLADLVSKLSSFSDDDWNILFQMIPFNLPIDSTVLISQDDNNE